MSDCYYFHRLFTKHFHLLFAFFNFDCRPFSIDIVRESQTNKPNETTNENKEKNCFGEQSWTNENPVADGHHFGESIDISWIHYIHLLFNSVHVRVAQCVPMRVSHKQVITVQNERIPFIGLCRMSQHCCCGEHSSLSLCVSNELNRIVNENGFAFLSVATILVCFDFPVTDISSSITSIE